MDVLERLGLPVFLVLFLCALVWKLWPHLIEWFKKSTEQSEIVSEAIPSIKDSLQKMAQQGQETMNRIEAKADQILEKVNHFPC